MTMGLAIAAAVCAAGRGRPNGSVIPPPSGPLAASSPPATQGATQPASNQPVATSRTDGFLKLLRDRLDRKLAERFAMVAGAIDWEELRREARKAPDPAARTERLAYVEFWKRLAEAHDFGMMCSRPNVFEWKACELLSGTHKPEKPLPYGDLGLPKGLACDYLLAEDLPAWAKSLRLCAAGALAGNGDRRGMDVLLGAMREAIRKPGGFHPIHEALRVTWTEEALPLWAEAARDADLRLRLMVVRNIEAIHADRATRVLLGMLKDEDREVRTAAATALMNRDVKDAAPVLLEKVCRELDGRIPSAHANAPICLKLQQWNVPGVPWEKVEAVLNDQVRTNVTDYWRAVDVAGWCLAAGREKVALPFLKSAMSVGVEKLDQLANLGTRPAQELTIAWHAAMILASNGRLEGIDLIRRYIDLGQGNWNHAYEGLMALAAFLNRPAVGPDDRKLAMAIAAKAVDRRDPLFKGYFWRALEALGEMGALVRVERRIVMAGEGLGEKGARGQVERIEERAVEVIPCRTGRNMVPLPAGGT